MIERLLTPIFIAIGVCGLAIALLSFGPWVHFKSAVPNELVLGSAPPEASFDISGLHTSRWRDEESVNRDDVKEIDGWCSCHVKAGDGYITAALGLMIVLAASVAVVAQRDKLAAGVALVASLAALGLTGFNALADWQALYYTDEVLLEAVNGSVQPALIVAVVGATLAALLSILAWSFARALELADEAEWDDPVNDEFDGSTESGTGADQWA